MMWSLRRGSRDKPGSEVNTLLHAAETSLGGPSPHGQTVQYVWEHVGLYEELQGMRGEMVAGLVQRKYDRVALSDRLMICETPM